MGPMQEDKDARARFESRVDAWRESALQALDAFASTRKVHYPHHVAPQLHSSHALPDKVLSPAPAPYASLTRTGASISDSARARTSSYCRAESVEWQSTSSSTKQGNHSVTSRVGSKNVTKYQDHPSEKAHRYTAWDGVLEACVADASDSSYKEHASMHHMPAATPGAAPTLLPANNLSISSTQVNLNRDVSTGIMYTTNRRARVSCAESLDEWGSGCEDGVSLESTNAGLGAAACVSSSNEAPPYPRPVSHGDAPGGDGGDEFEFSRNPSQVDSNGHVGFHQDTAPVVHTPTFDWVFKMEKVADVLPVEEGGSVHNDAADGLRGPGGNCADDRQATCVNGPDNASSIYPHTGNSFTAPSVACTQQCHLVQAAERDPKGLSLLSDSPRADPLRTPIAEPNGCIVAANQLLPPESSQKQEQDTGKPEISNLDYKEVTIFSTRNHLSGTPDVRELFRTNIDSNKRLAEQDMLIISLKKDNLEWQRKHKKMKTELRHTTHELRTLKPASARVLQDRETLQGLLQRAELRIQDLQTVLDASDRDNAALRDNIAAVCERNEVVHSEHGAAVAELTAVKHTASQLCVSKEVLEMELRRLQQLNTELVAGSFQQEVRSRDLGLACWALHSWQKNCEVCRLLRARQELARWQHVRAHLQARGRRAAQEHLRTWRLCTHHAKGKLARKLHALQWWRVRMLSIHWRRWRRVLVGAEVLVDRRRRLRASLLRRAACRAWQGAAESCREARVEDAALAERADAHWREFTTRAHLLRWRERAAAKLATRRRLEQALVHHLRRGVSAAVGAWYRHCQSTRAMRRIQLRSRRRAARDLLRGWREVKMRAGIAKRRAARAAETRVRERASVCVWAWASWTRRQRVGRVVQQRGGRRTCCCFFLAWFARCSECLTLRVQLQQFHNRHTRKVKVCAWSAWAHRSCSTRVTRALLTRFAADSQRHRLRAWRACIAEFRRIHDIHKHAATTRKCMIMCWAVSWWAVHTRRRARKMTVMRDAGRTSQSKLQQHVLEAWIDCWRNSKRTAGSLQVAAARVRRRIAHLVLARWSDASEVCRSRREFASRARRRVQRWRARACLAGWRTQHFLQAHASNLVLAIQFARKKRLLQEFKGAASKSIWQRSQLEKGLRRRQFATRFTTIRGWQLWIDAIRRSRLICARTSLRLQKQRRFQCFQEWLERTVQLLRLKRLGGRLRLQFGRKLLCRGLSAWIGFTQAARTTARSKNVSSVPGAHQVQLAGVVAGSVHATLVLMAPRVWRRRRQLAVLCAWWARARAARAAQTRVCSFSHRRNLYLTRAIFQAFTQSWRRSAAQRARLAVATTRLDWSRKAGALRAWQLASGSARSRRRMVARLLARAARRCLYKSYEVWTSSMVAADTASMRADGLALALKRRSLQAHFHTWVALCNGSAQAAHEVALADRLHLARRALEAWRQHCACIRYRWKVSCGISKCHQLRVCAGALARWTRALQQRRACNRAIRSMRRRAVWAVLSAWADVVVRTFVTRMKTIRIQHQHRKKCVCALWSSWVGYGWRRRRERRLVQRLKGVHRHRHLIRVFSSWVSVVHANRSKRCIMDLRTCLEESVISSQAKITHLQSEHQMSLAKAASIHEASLHQVQIDCDNSKELLNMELEKRVALMRTEMSKQHEKYQAQHKHLISLHLLESERLEHLVVCVGRRAQARRVLQRIVISWSCIVQGSRKAKDFQQLKAQRLLRLLTHSWAEQTQHASTMQTKWKLAVLHHLHTLIYAAFKLWARGRHVARDCAVVEQMKALSDAHALELSAQGEEREQGRHAFREMLAVTTTALLKKKTLLWERAVERILSRHRLRIYRNTFEVWCDLSSHAKYTIAHADALQARLAIRQLSAALQAWSFQVQCSMRQHGLVFNLAVKRWHKKARAIISGWKEWKWWKLVRHGMVHSQLRRRAAAAKSAAFFQWVRRALVHRPAKHQRECTVAARAGNARCRRVLRAWKCQQALSRRLRVVEGRVQRRLRSRCQQKMFQAWAGECSQATCMAWRNLYVEKLFLRCMWSCKHKFLHHWRRHIQVLGHVRRGRARTAMRGWKAAVSCAVKVDDAQCRLSHRIIVVSKMRLTKLQFTLRAWRQGLDAHRHVQVLLYRSIHRQLWKFQWHALMQWWSLTQRLKRQIHCEANRLARCLAVHLTQIVQAWGAVVLRKLDMRSKYLHVRRKLNLFVGRAALLAWLAHCLKVHKDAARLKKASCSHKQRLLRGILMTWMKTSWEMLRRRTLMVTCVNSMLDTSETLPIICSGSLFLVFRSWKVVYKHNQQLRNVVRMAGGHNGTRNTLAVTAAFLRMRLYAAHARAQARSVGRYVSDGSRKCIVKVMRFWQERVTGKEHTRSSMHAIRRRRLVTTKQCALRKWWGCVIVKAQHKESVSKCQKSRSAARARSSLGWWRDWNEFSKGRKRRFGWAMKRQANNRKRVLVNSWAQLCHREQKLLVLLKQHMRQGRAACLRKVVVAWWAVHTRQKNFQSEEQGFHNHLAAVLARAYYKWAIWVAGRVFDKALQMVRDKAAAIDIGALRLAVSQDNSVSVVGHSVRNIISGIRQVASSPEQALLMVRNARTALKQSQSPPHIWPNELSPLARGMDVHDHKLANPMSASKPPSHSCELHLSQLYESPLQLIDPCTCESRALSPQPLLFMQSTNMSMSENSVNQCDSHGSTLQGQQGMQTMDNEAQARRAVEMLLNDATLKVQTNGSLSNFTRTLSTSSPVMQGSMLHQSNQNVGKEHKHVWELSNGTLDAYQTSKNASNEQTEFVTPNTTSITPQPCESVQSYPRVTSSTGDIPTQDMRHGQSFGIPYHISTEMLDSGSEVWNTAGQLVNSEFAHTHSPRKFRSRQQHRAKLQQPHRLPDYLQDCDNTYQWETSHLERDGNSYLLVSSNVEMRNSYTGHLWSDDLCQNAIEMDEELVLDSAASFSFSPMHNKR